MKTYSNLTSYNTVYTVNHLMVFLTFFLLTLSFNSFASESSNNFNLSEVAEGNFVHLGKHVSIEDKQRDDIANLGFIIGDNCIAVIDTGGSITIGKLLLDKIRSISDKPICYVINTHVHFDHVLGNKAFTVEKPIFVGHQKLADAFEHNREFFLTQFKDDLGPNPDASSIVGPSELIEQSKQIDLGNRTLTLIAYPVSHSHNDLIVIDDKTKTLWAGDLIFRERVPSLTGSLKGWIQVIKDLRTLEINKVVPGHGSIANSVNDAIEKQQAYLQSLLDETRKAIAEGQFVNDAMENIDKENHWEWLLHEFQHPTNVSKAFTELEWE